MTHRWAVKRDWRRQGSPSVSVVNGVFILQLDFGTAAFPFGSNRYLEIAVRPAGSPNPHTVLGPRQQILSVPYALKSLKAFEADSASNSANAFQFNGLPVNRFVQYDATNNVGIATTPTNSRLTVNGTIELIAGGIKFPDGTIQSTAAGLTNAILNQTTLQTGANFNIDGNGFVGGNVGIGTTTASEKLTVQTPTTNYGLVHTDGDVTVGTFVGGSSEFGGWFGTKSDHDLHFFTNNGPPRMTITSSGKLDRHD